jgi:hypothetical protein
MTLKCAKLPQFLAKNESFIPILPDLFSPEESVTQTIYYVIKANLKSNARVRALIDFFKEKIALNMTAKPAYKEDSAPPENML